MRGQGSICGASVAVGFDGVSMTNGRSQMKEDSPGRVSGRGAR